MRQPPVVWPFAQSVATLRHSPGKLIAINLDQFGERHLECGGDAVEPDYVDAVCAEFDEADEVAGYAGSDGLVQPG
jgi:hypothetical protein